MINLVVIGHFADYLSYMRLSSALVLFIYSFHMQMFFFVSGLFLKYDEKHKLRMDKVVFYIFVGIVIKVGIYLVDLATNSSPEWKWLSENNVPWYMFVTAAYLILTYILKNLDPRIVLPVSVVIALLAGYIDSIGNFLCLSRLIVFYPFFYAGFCLDPETVQQFFKKKIIKITGISFLFVISIVYLFANDILAPILRPIYYGRFPYSEMPYPQYGVLLRLLQYVLAVMLFFGIGALLPINKIKFITAAGSRTLPVYVIHYFVLRIIVAFNIHTLLADNFSYFGLLIWFVIAIAVSCVLSFPCFSKPFSFLQSSMSKLFCRGVRTWIL